jgi:hypothetical protein
MTALLPSLLLTWLFEAGEEGDAGVDLAHDGLDLPHDLLVALLLDHPEARSIQMCQRMKFQFNQD